MSELTKNQELVWYVCYGSNLCYERFLCYLTGEGSKRYGILPKPGGRCLNPNPPLKTAVTMVPYPLYFARRSSTWQKMGVAFIDPHKDGITIGRAYLVTKEQYLHVKKREGDWYQHEVRLDDIEGIPAYTFTSDVRHPFVMPSDNYRKVIEDGLMECGLHIDAAKTYLDTYIKMARAGD